MMKGKRPASAREAPAVEDLIRRAREHRPDLRAYRLGLQRAQLEWLQGTGRAAQPDQRPPLAEVSDSGPRQSGE